MKRQTFIVTFAIFTIICLSVAQVVVSNRLSTAGMVFEKIEDEIHFYRTQNSLLSERLLSSSSLNSIASRAAILGFVENKSQAFVLKTSLPFALKSP